MRRGGGGWISRRVGRWANRSLAELGNGVSSHEREAGKDEQVRQYVGGREVAQLVRVRVRVRV